MLPGLCHPWGQEARTPTGPLGYSRRSRMADLSSSFHPAADPSGAGWVAPRLLAWWSLPDGFTPVGGLVPTGFESYARLLHPPERAVDARSGPLRWAELAARNGVSLGPGTLWEDVARGGEAQEVASPPSEGHLSAGVASALVDVLEKWTSSPEDCWFCVWDGYGALDPDTRWPGAARLHLPGRSYVVLRGPVRAAASSLEPPPFRQSANLWWPQDHSWCVATEIDLSWTYVGGSESCIREVLADGRLEAIPVLAEDRVAGSQHHLKG